MDIDVKSGIDLGLQFGFYAGAGSAALTAVANAIGTGGKHLKEITLSAGKFGLLVGAAVGLIGFGVAATDNVDNVQAFLDQSKFILPAIVASVAALLNINNGGRAMASSAAISGLATYALNS